MHGNDQKIFLNEKVALCIEVAYKGMPDRVKYAKGLCINSINYII